MGDRGDQKDVVIVEGVRTPLIKSGIKAETAKISAVDLGKVALKELIARANLDANNVDEVIIGNTGSPVDAVNISRVIALGAGMPLKTSATTTHRNCASGMESITSGFDKIKSGTNEVVIAGGTENMTQFPLLFPKGFTRVFEKLAGAKSLGSRLGALKDLFKADMKQVVELMTTDPMKNTDYKPTVAVIEGLMDPFVGINMGQTAEILAKEFGISRNEQDQFALQSHLKAAGAMEKLRQEIVPLMVPPQFEKIVCDDIGPRANQTMEALAKLKPFFDKKTGSITAGNACPLTDGAAMLLLMSRKRANELGYKPLAKIRSYAFAGLEPERMGLGPVYSTPVALKRAGLTMKEIGLIEINEAFAAQVLSCCMAFDSDEFARNKLGLSAKVGSIDTNILNVNGGAIAIGHPIGATGTRLVLTLAKEMVRRQVQFGLATLCIGGGQGGAVILEKEN